MQEGKLSSSLECRNKGKVEVESRKFFTDNWRADLGKVGPLKKVEGGDREQNHSISRDPHLAGLIEKCQIQGADKYGGQVEAWQGHAWDYAEAGGQGREQKTGWGGGGGGGG
jgi:hypothetical protein